MKEFPDETTQTTQPTPPKVTWWQRLLVGGSPKRTLTRILILGVTAFVSFKYWLIPIQVVGDSMYPTYQSGQVNLVNRRAFSHRTPQRGDVVAIGTTGVRVMILKRIIGVPGDYVRMRGGIIYVNGEPIAEPYIKDQGGLSTPRPVKLKENEYWVAGDNRKISEFGVVERTQIVGVPLL